MKKIKNKLGIIILLILSFLPAAIWFTMLPLKIRFGSLMPALTSLGQITGLVGMVMFSLTLVLALRLKFFEDYFGGMNRVYLYHHIFGGTALILLLAHPLLLAIKFIPVSSRSAALFLLPGQDIIVDFGIYSLLILMSLLIITFFAKLKYQVWKNSHKFLGMAFFLGGLHVYFIPSDISRNIPLRYYMLALSAIGLSAFLYRTVFGWLFVKKSLYTVAAVSALNNKITEIELKPLGKKLDYGPGQFIFISFQGPGINPESHPFSIVSNNRDANLRIIVKSLGDYTNLIALLTPGTKAKIEGAFGRFSYKNSNNSEQVWIAGGIGITPFLGMAGSLALENNSDYKVDLYYCVRNDKEAVFSNKLMALARKNINLRLIKFCSNEHGWINAGFIRQNSGNLNNKDFFLCGPGRLMSDLKKQLLGLNILPKNIHSEEFNF